MDLPGPAHIVFIPGVLLIGAVIGFVLGGRAARQELERKRRRARE